MLKNCKSTQFRYLCPRSGNVSIAELSEFVNKRFVLVGVTDELVAFMVVLAQLFNLPDVARSITGNRVNIVHHKSFRELVTDAEYANAKGSCKQEAELYAWAKARWEKTKRCFDQGWLEEAVKNATERSHKESGPANHPRWRGR